MFVKIILHTTIMSQYGNKKTKKQKTLDYTVRVFKHDSMLDTLLSDLIDFYRELRLLLETYGCMSEEYIPQAKKYRIEFLKAQTYYLSTLLVS